MKILIAFVICGLIEATRAQDCIVNPNSINVALFGNVCQSSTFISMPHPGPERAVDGITDTNHSIHTCSITNLEYEASWTLNMGESYRMDSIFITFRQDGCIGCMNGAQIRIGDSPDGNNPVCATIKTVTSPNMKFSCTGMLGQYVTIIHPKKAGIITMCEVRAYTYVPPPQA